MVETLMDGLLSEIERCSKLKVAYDDIVTGAFGSIVVQQAIDNAKAAIVSGDVEQMIKALEICEGRKQMNPHRTVIHKAAHKRRQKDRGVAVTTVKEYLTVQKEKRKG